jgi:hypothetical protein
MGKISHGNLIIFMMPHSCHAQVQESPSQRGGAGLRDSVSFAVACLWFLLAENR